MSDDVYRRILTAFGWSHPVEQRDVMLGPDGPASMTTVGWVVRLRIEEGDCRMQYKGKLSNEAEHLEAEVGVDSVHGAAELLSLMGLRLGLVIKRARRSVDVAGARLALDDVTTLGRFLEIEAIGGQDLDPTADLVQQFGLSEECGPYGDLILKGIEVSGEWAKRYAREKAEVLADLGLELVFPAKDRTWPSPS
ncbi:MAG TPA: CYTH domain-containing protein [Amycolatopsis sp.]|uniref:CYTH domain-containing protein n=1 Tax=Amycolatopsis sp. TaxID=37632 RepID=UPI002B48EC11|nr:CYTH domain-containing protein [Amycolatopsis sp.]HKS45315.1 CYTH domain-containing protein [Amycolatopsis sp.]